MTRKIVQLTVGALLLALGVVTYAGLDPTGLVVILPAIPFYMFSAWLDPSARRGVFWDSAHSPPFLNTLGIACVYIIPGLLLVALALFAKRPPRKLAAN